MANGAFKFKDNSGNVVASLSNSGSNIVISGGTLDLSGMTGLTLGNVTMSGTTQNASTASFAPNYLLSSSFNSYTGTTNAQSRLSSLETTTGSLNSFTSSANSRLNSIEGVSGSLATTGSNQFKNNQTITGSLTVTGYIESQELRTTYISSSILYRSGSTKFGDESSDNHSFTGSLIVNGNITSVGTGIVRSVIETTGGVQEPSLQFKTTLGSYYLGNYPNTSIFYFDNRTGYRTSFQVDGTEKVAIGATGNLSVTGSITTTSSATFLGTMSATGEVRSINGGVDGTFSDAFVGVYSSNNNEQNSIQTAVSSNAGLSGFRFQVSNGGGSSGRTTVADFKRDRQIFYTNVGIGTDSPNVKLEVLDTSTSSGEIARFQRNVDQINEYSYVRVGNNSYPAYFGSMLGTYDIAYMSMSPNPSDGKALSIRTTDGNVGIGVLNPSKKLEVNGRMSTTAIVSGNLVAGNIYSNISTSPSFIIICNLNNAAGFSLSGKINAASYTCWNVSDVYIRKDYSALTGTAVITGVAKSGCDFSVVDISYNGDRFIALRFTGNPEIDVMWTGYRLAELFQSDGTATVLTSGVSVNSTYASY